MLAILGTLFILFYKKEEQKQYSIGIDAGHGGEDTGAIGYIQESELTEKTADLLEELLEKDGRFKIIRSRKNGENVNIVDRRELFLKKEVNLILSIHGNSDPTGTARGFECYPSPPGRKTIALAIILLCVLQRKCKKQGII